VVAAVDAAEAVEVDVGIDVEDVASDTPLATGTGATNPLTLVIVGWVG